MTIKTESKSGLKLLNNRQYSGMVAMLLYNWPIFLGAALFSLVTIGLSFILPPLWQTLFLVSGGGVLGLAMIILLASYMVYDWGDHHEYDRLAELSKIGQANVVVDITCGKLRGTRGLLPYVSGGHYFLIDIYETTKMKDLALQRARQIEPPLNTSQRLYRRTGQPGRLPLPHNWVDIIYCHCSLHELLNPADRQAIFADFARMLKPTGQLLIAEHDRDWQNLLAFGPGVLSFFTKATWEKDFAQAGLVIRQHERWRGLMNLWVIERQ